MEQGIAKASEQVVNGLANGAHLIMAGDFNLAGQVLVVHGKPNAIKQAADLEIDGTDNHQHQHQYSQNGTCGNAGGQPQVVPGVGNAF